MKKKDIEQVTAKLYEVFETLVDIKNCTDGLDDKYVQQLDDITGTLENMCHDMKKKSGRRMRFGTWCRKDENDETKIVYNFTESNGHILYFTSEDNVSYSMIQRIRNAWVESIRRVQNEFQDCWYAVLYED